MKIWTIDDSLIDKIVDRYIDYVTNSKSLDRQTSHWQINSIGKSDLKPEKRALKYDRSIRSRMNYGEYNTPATIINLPKPQKLPTRAAFISLIHQLYLRKINAKNGQIVLNSRILQKINRHYNYMLETLCNESYISCHRESVGEFAKNIYYLNPTIKFKYIECDNVKVIDDLKKISKEFEKIHKKEIEKAKKLTSPQFIKSYNKSLRYFKITNLEAAIQYINDIFQDNTNNQKHYYENICNKITNNQFKEIDRADSNGRIYHIVTQLPKSIRKFTNINKIVDTKNSHPLLFNYYTLEYYFNYNNIINKNNNYYKLYSIISLFIIQYYNLYSYHYFRRNLCNELIDKGYGGEIVDIVKKIKSDVWEYLYTTSRGKLWDDINQAYPDFTRDEIKKEMFRSLFYSRSLNISRDKTYAKAFQSQYPTIARIIRYYKMIYHNQCKEQKLYVYKKGHYCPV